MNAAAFDLSPWDHAERRRLLAALRRLIAQERYHHPEELVQALGIHHRSLVHTRGQQSAVTAVAVTLLREAGKFFDHRRPHRR